uniref:Uncharacterized protein n=1 Tax=Arundo donax TaxID=35708 RepID=A0A0A8Z5M8_ARUDO
MWFYLTSIRCDRGGSIFFLSGLFLF